MKFHLAVVIVAAMPLFAAEPAKEGERAPIADHHQHLQSPATAALANRTLPAVQVDPDIAALLRSREDAWNDATRLSEIFTRDAQVFTGGNPGWAQGAAAASEWLSRRAASPYRMTPTYASVAPSQARLSGYYTRGDKRIGYFNLTLEKGGDGRWRIAAEVPTFPGPPIVKQEDAADLIRYLDDAGIRLAAVLSDAYYFDSPKNDVRDRHAMVRAENDWTAEQVARFPRRLVAFCSFNPLADYALDELERCAKSGRFAGIKLHFGMSAVNLRDPAHVARVRAVVERANARKLPLIVHVREGAAYGREEARVLLDHIVSAAPDVAFQIAHLWGGEAFSEDALAVYADAVSAQDTRTRHLYFDLAEVALVAGDRMDVRQKITAQMRRIGLGRILYATDGPVEESQAPADGWKSTRSLALSPEELARIADNVAPYLRALAADLK